jgi:hypothetical protein
MAALSSAPSLKPVADRAPPAAAAAGEFMVNASDIASVRDRLKKVEAVAAKVSRDGTATMAFKNGENVAALLAVAVTSHPPHLFFMLPLQALRISDARTRPMSSRRRRSK